MVGSVKVVVGGEAELVVTPVVELTDAAAAIGKAGVEAGSVQESVQGSVPDKQVVEVLPVQQESMAHVLHTGAQRTICHAAPHPQPNLQVSQDSEPPC